MGVQPKSTAVVGSGRSRILATRRARLALLAVGAVLVIGGIAAGVYLLSRDEPKPAPAYVKSDYKLVQHELDQRIAASGLKDGDKADIYISKARTAITQKKYDDALASALEAQKLQPNDIETVHLLAYVYQNKGDKVNAIKYYNQAIELVKSTAGPAANTAQQQQYYQQQIDALNE